jgi:hypothetical protein
LVCPSRYFLVNLGFVAAVTLLSAIAPSVVNADILLKDSKAV